MMYTGGTKLSQHPDKEIFSDSSPMIVSLNGVHVFTDNKFEEETLKEAQPGKSFFQELKKAENEHKENSEH